MKINKVLLMGLLLIPVVFPQTSFSQNADQIEQFEKLLTKRETIRKWAPLCADGSQSHGHCPFGDMTIFSGLLCLSGETARCDDVKRSQGIDGRWWRSPELLGDDTQKNTFSRDQALGALAYLVATKDVDAAKRWKVYLDAHNNRMCPDATDNRCVITAGTGRLFGAVFKYLGLPTEKWMNRGEWYSNVYDQIEASVQPNDFPMHLNAANAWIRSEIESRGGPSAEPHAQKIIKILVKREPTNPFFLLLRQGPTKEVADIILQKCPDIKPSDALLDWAWQRRQDAKVWLHASGHDCIFAINLFEKAYWAARSCSSPFLHHQQSRTARGGIFPKR